MQTPPILYKYYSADTFVEILKNHCIKMASLHNYNDALELYPSYDGEKIPMASEDMINKIIENIPSSKMNSEEDMFHYIVSKIFDCYNFEYQGQEDILTQAKFLSKAETPFIMAEYIRRCTLCSCFSESPLIDLMWAHYANKHMGVCIGFSTDLLSNCALKKIEYQDERVDVKLLEAKGRKAIAYTKGMHWAYEQEWRFLHAFNIPVEFISDQELNYKDFSKIKIKNGFMFAKSFSWNDVREIYLGCRLPTSIMEDVKTSLIQYKDIKYYQVVPDNRRFALIKKEIKF